MPSYVIARRKRNVLTSNYTEVGNFAKISNGVASGFSASQYLVVPENMDVTSNKTWEIHTKFVYGGASKQANLFAGQGNQYIIFYTNNSNKLVFNIGDGSEWVSGEVVSSTTLTTGSTYYYKLVYNGSSITQYLSKDGVSWSSEGSYNGSVNIPVFTMRIGIGRGTVWPSTSSIDLNESYIKINDELWWSGDSYRGIGSWNNDNNVSGFTASNYLKLPKSFAPANNPWEVSIPFITGAFNARQRIFNSTTNFVGVMLVIEPAGTFTLALSSGNTSWDIGAPVSTKTISANVMYTAKISFTGTQYKLDIYNHNSGTWENYITVDNSSPVSANTYFIGRSENDSFPQPLSGLIDLNNSHIKINNELWWSGTKLMPENKYYVLRRKRNRYYKDVVTTKYWKEITTGGRELEYACYKRPDPTFVYYWYAKAPIGSDTTAYATGEMYVWNPATSSSQLQAIGNYTWSSLTESIAILKGDTEKWTRYTAGDLYKDTTTTTVVEGTAEDYTYTTTETTTIEVTENDDYDRVESGGESTYFPTLKGVN